MMPGRRKRINISLFIPFLVVALVFGVLIRQKYQASREVPPTPQIVQPSGPRTAVLFFVSNGNRLARESREVEPCDGTAACVKVVLEELFNGPVWGLDEALPEGAALKGVRIEGDKAIVDVNRSFAAELPSGSSAEMLAVYSVVDTVCVNFPQIAKVLLTIEGEGKTTLSHLDISEPLAPDYSLEQAPASAEPGKTVTPPTPDAKKGHP
jgi:spore germination protein GerM